MSSNKKRSRKGDNIKYRKQLKLLREYGLISKKTNLRKRVTPAQKRTIKKYSDVLTGKAKVIEAKDKKQAAKFKQQFDVKGDKIIVPVQKGERVSFNKKKGTLKTSRKVAGKTVKRELTGGELAKLGFGQYYVIQFGGGQKFRTNDFKVLQDFMMGYEKKPHKPFKNWKRYVEIETIEEQSGDEIAISKYRPRYKKATKKRSTRSRRK